MLVVEHALLCAAALLISHGVDPVRAGPSNFGGLGRRVFSNDSSTTVVSGYTPESSISSLNPNHDDGPRYTVPDMGSISNTHSRSGIPSIPSIIRNNTSSRTTNVTFTPTSPPLPPRPTGRLNGTTLSTTTATSQATDEPGETCTEDGETVTVWTVVHPFTTTLTADPTKINYTNPYPPISIPGECTGATTTTTTPLSTWSISNCDGPAGTCTSYFTLPTTSSGDNQRPRPSSTISTHWSVAPPEPSTSTLWGPIETKNVTSTVVWGPGETYTHTVTTIKHGPIGWTTWEAPSSETTSAFTLPGQPKNGKPSVTIPTTDKNPVVVWPSTKPPRYGGDGGAPTVLNHKSAAAADSGFIAPEYNWVTSTPQPAKASPSPHGTSDSSSSPVKEVTVIVHTTDVVINGHTFTNNNNGQSKKTSTVVIDANTFVINPSQVIGAGATITRPANIGGIFVPVPQTTTVGGLQVVYGPAAASIDGTVFTVGATPTTAVIRGQTITVGPAGIKFPSQTIPMVAETGPLADRTSVAVLGGELLTAVGSSEAVIRGTTFTYSADDTTLTKRVDDDTVLIGPWAILVHGKTLGGANGIITTAATSLPKTAYEMVGGATVTQLGWSAVVIRGRTYAIGDAATTAITTVVGGQTLTIGPDGVAAASDTFAQPYAMTTVLGAAAAAAASTGTSRVEVSDPPQATAAGPTTTEEENGAGLALRPGWVVMTLSSCIAMGVRGL